MQQEWRKNVHSGHNILDRNGRNVGRVKNVYEQATAAGGPPVAGGGYVEVESNLPNLRKTLYIPFDTFQDCTGDSCRLSLTQDELANKGWDEKPATF